MSDDEVSYNTLFNQRLKNIKYHSRPEPKPPEKQAKAKLNNTFNHVSQSQNGTTTPGEEPKKPKPEKLIPALNEIYNRAVQKEKEKERERKEKEQKEKEERERKEKEEKEASITSIFK